MKQLGNVIRGANVAAIIPSSGTGALAKTRCDKMKNALRKIG